MARQSQPPAATRPLRFLLVGLVAYLGAAHGLPALQALWPPAGYPLAYYLLQVTAVKLLGDLVYFGVSSRYREAVHLEDYLANDFFTFYRFSLPLAVFQAFLLATGRIPYYLVTLWPRPVLATILYLANRLLVEQAQDQRRKQRGGIPLVGGRRS